MSSLGLLARDSMVDLASMNKEDSEKSLLTDMTDKPSDSSITNKSIQSSSSSNSGPMISKEIGRTSFQAIPTSAANPQQAHEDDENVNSATQQRRRSSRHSYTGFNVNSYPEYSNNNTMYDLNMTPEVQYSNSSTYSLHDTYAPVLLHQKKSSGGFLCCLFPWLATAQNRRLPEGANSTAANTSTGEISKLSVDVNSAVPGDNESTDDNASYAERVKGDVHPTSTQQAAAIAAASVDDELSTTSSDNLGERLSEKEQQALLNRLRLGQPDEAKETPSRDDGESLSDKDSFDDGENGLPPMPGQARGILKRSALVSSRSITLEKKSSIRRSIGVNGSYSNPTRDGSRRRSLFPNYGSTAPSKKNHHHVVFSPMARVINVRARTDMTPEDKADIWWQRSDYDEFRKTGRIITRAMLEGGSEIWLANKGSASSDSVDGDKWWHKFGHSRRGLEHVVCIDEGKQRQQNVRKAIHAVLDEQRRQKLYSREDAEKLRTVALLNTTWARDLALAAGSSDADAVMSNFDRERKSREFYLLKLSRMGSNTLVSSARRMPEFMKPSMPSNSPAPIHKVLVQAPILDANTAAQISFRRKQLLASGSSESKRSLSSGSSIAEKSSDSNGDSTAAKSHRRVESLSKRAAGFSADQTHKVDMAAVLSGMGAIPQEAHA